MIRANGHACDSRFPPIQIGMRVKMKNRQPRTGGRLTSAVPAKRLHNWKGNRMIPTQQNRPPPRINQRTDAVLNRREDLLCSRGHRSPAVWGRAGMFALSRRGVTFDEFQVSRILERARRGQIQSQLRPHVASVRPQGRANFRGRVPRPPQIRRLPIKWNSQKCWHAQVIIHRLCHNAAEPTATEGSALPAGGTSRAYILCEK